MWQANQNCGRKISAPDGKQIRIFISDISVEKQSNDNK